MSEDVDKKQHQIDRQDIPLKKQNNNKDKIDKYPQRDIDYVF